MNIYFTFDSNILLLLIKLNNKLYFFFKEINRKVYHKYILFFRNQITNTLLSNFRIKNIL